MAIYTLPLTSLLFRVVLFMLLLFALFIYWIYHRIVDEMSPSNGYICILLYTCGPGTNSFSHNASVYLVKEKVLSLVWNMCTSGKVDEDTQVQLQASDLD